MSTGATLCRAPRPGSGTSPVAVLLTEMGEHLGVCTARTRPIGESNHGGRPQLARIAGHPEPSVMLGAAFRFPTCSQPERVLALGRRLRSNTKLPFPRNCMPRAALSSPTTAAPTLPRVLSACSASRTSGSGGDQNLCRHPARWHPIRPRPRQTPRRRLRLLRSGRSRKSAVGRPRRTTPGQQLRPC